jgi:DNA-binding transcriptional LysR family regulator
MDRYQEMSSFVAVVDSRSFVGAANATGQSTTAVSRHVGELEQRLGVRLLQRTTRRLSVTPEGEAFYSRCKEVLAAIEEAESEVTTQSVEPSGLIRVNAPLTFGVLHLAPLWGRFIEQYPKVAFDVTLSDRVVDLVEEGYDLAVRITRMPNSTLVSRKLASSRLVLCASRRYLDTHGVPTDPHDLSGHRVISYSYLASGDEWQFQGPGGPVSVRVSAKFHTNNGDTCRVAALAGQGIILQPDFLVADDIRRGGLVELMPEYRAVEIGIYAVYPTRKHLPLKLRRLVDFLVAAFHDPPWQRGAGS